MAFAIEILATLLRFVLSGWAATLIQRGILSQGQVDKLVYGLVVGILTLAWSLWQKYRSRIKFLVAAGSGTALTENEVKDAIARGVTVSVTTPKDETPKINAGGAQ